VTKLFYVLHIWSNLKWQLTFNFLFKFSKFPTLRAENSQELKFHLATNALAYHGCLSQEYIVHAAEYKV